MPLWRLFHSVLIPLIAANASSHKDAFALISHTMHYSKQFLGVDQASSTTVAAQAIPRLVDICTSTKLCKTWSQRSLAVVAGVFILVVASTIFLLAWRRFVYKTLEALVGELDRDNIGVDIEVKSSRISPCSGVVELYDLIVTNPVGYSSPYLMKSTRICIGVDALSVCNSYRKEEVRITKVVVHDLDVVMEKTRITSNAQEALDCLKERQDVAKAKKTTYEAFDTGIIDQTRQVKLHEVHITDVGVKLQMDTTAVGNLGMRFAYGDIVYENFHEDHGSGCGQDLVVILLELVLKRVIHTVTGKVAQDDSGRMCDVPQDARISCEDFEPAILKNPNRNPNVKKVAEYLLSPRAVPQELGGTSARSRSYTA